eukprot:6205249-Pleurochrysis_carterae.AAC.3
MGCARLRALEQLDDGLEVLLQDLDGLFAVGRCAPRPWGGGRVAVSRLRVVRLVRRRRLRVAEHETPRSPRTLAPRTLAHTLTHTHARRRAHTRSLSPSLSHSPCSRPLTLVPAVRLRDALVAARSQALVSTTAARSRALSLSKTLNRGPFSRPPLNAPSLFTTPPCASASFTLHLSRRSRSLHALLLPLPAGEQAKRALRAGVENALAQDASDRACQCDCAGRKRRFCCCR